ncbi:hypothetical protein M422DRAFT_274706 [Sphaerobolus stellatus SS14]|uniref:Peptidase A1 domain-containing protein n=1 Tax=Sphaerobolus stellatus (strain SS14) TaxID=990650 RepID=A0A0C9UH35_SPHS4|nr:hypothetical protein M422DRAFT_274706 [Sphaerobolus stellatus SS14]
MSGPDDFTSNDPDLGANLYYVNNILLGTPPASLYMSLDASFPDFIVSSESCILCSGSDSSFFDPSLSTTFVSLNGTKLVTEPRIVSSGQDALSFGGIVGTPSRDSAIKVIEWLQGDFAGTAIQGPGSIVISAVPQTKAGLYVDIVNETLRASHPLTQFYEQGLLKNPVVGFSLKTVGNESYITIGALDQEDYAGELNWVEAEVPQSSWELPTVISIDAIGGFLEGKGDQKIPLYLNTILPTILLPFNSTIDFPNTSRRADDILQQLTSDSIFDQLTMKTFNCDFPLPAATNSNQNIFFENIWYPLKEVLPVVINGVTYNVDLAKNLAILGSPSTGSMPGICNSGLNFYNSTISSVQGSLGLPFFRSVYVAYRFPTADCPKAFYGFAFQKGSNVSASLIAQKPTSTPTSSAQCLQFSAPTETPTLNIPTIAPRESVGYDGKYKIFGKEDAPEVPLINAEELMGVDWPMPNSP